MLGDDLHEALLAVLALDPQPLEKDHRDAIAKAAERMGRTFTPAEAQAFRLPGFPDMDEVGERILAFMRQGGREAAEEFVSVVRANKVVWHSTLGVESTDGG